MDVTAVGTMLTAAFTLLLAVLALWAGIQARSAAKAAWTDVKEQQRIRKEAQASRVYSSPVQLASNAARMDTPWLRVFNASDLPIYDITVTIEDRTTIGNTAELRSPSIMPGANEQMFVPEHVLTTRWGWTAQTDAHGNRYYVAPDHAEGPTLAVTVTFRDASSQRWRRDPTGRLAPATQGVDAE